MFDNYISGSSSGGSKNRKQQQQQQSRFDDGDSDPFTCKVEFAANESRSGVLDSNDLVHKLRKNRCRLTFRGNPGDVFMLRLNNFKLR